MQFDWWTLALQTVNFGVLVWLLHRFLYKPVLRMIDARRAEVDRQYAEVGKAEADAKAQLAAIETERSGIAAERTAALKIAAAEAEEAAAARRAQAEREAAALLEGARKTIAGERDEALSEARKAALDLGVDVARRLLAEIPAELRAEAWLERIERHVANLPVAERSEIAKALDAGSTLHVVTAITLPEQATKEWRVRLKRALGEEIAITFDVDPALIAGAEVHFANAIVRFSWRSTLETMRSEVAP